MVIEPWKSDPILNIYLSKKKFLHLILIKSFILSFRRLLQEFVYAYIIEQEEWAKDMLEEK